MERRYYLADEDTADIAANILGEAFSTDPISNWISTRDEYHKFVFTMLMPFYLEHGEVWISEANDAAIMCLKPGVTKEFSPSLRQILSFLWKFGPGALKRILHLSSVFKKYHQSEPHYYGLALGTTKSARGTGAGVDTARFLMDRARKLNVPIFAENSNTTDNRDFYRSLGFEIGEEISIEKGAPSFDLISFRPAGN